MLVSRELDAGYWALRIAFGLGPLLAGLDKFTNFLVNWEKYLSPVAQRMLPISAFFSCSRWICHTPRPASTAKPNRNQSVGPSRGRNRIIAPGSAIFARAVESRSLLSSRIDHAVRFGAFSGACPPYPVFRGGSMRLVAMTLMQHGVKDRMLLSL